ncbi:MAG: hypothetical protein QM737_01240 [Ferruginibacter sp.]
MKERLLRVLNIKHSETSQVFDLLTVQFFIGLANALVNVIALTLFIHYISIKSLPVVYLVVAVLMIVLNFVYEKLEHKFSPLALLKYIIGFGAVILFICWLGLSYANEHNFIFVLLVASFLVYMVTGYAYWGLVSLLFNVRESRRIFSVVGSGEIPAKLLGYIAGSLLIPLLHADVLWLAILALCLGFFLFHRSIRKPSWDLIKKRSHELHHHQDAELKKEGIISFFFNNRLIFTISLLSILSYNVFVLVDFTFISQVKIRFESLDDLAAYISMFFAVGRVIALGFKLIFTSRVIERLGVIYCLFITPVALFLFCIGFLIYGGDDATYNLYIFGLMTLLTEVLRSTMQEPVFFILFQPLKEKLRLKGHIISKGYTYPPSLIIVGGSLLFLYYRGIEITILLAVKVVIINLCVWACIIFFMRRTYLHTIHASIRKGIFNSDDIYFTDQKTIDILLAKINAGKRIEVIYALNLLENSGYTGLDQLLEKQLQDSKDIEVKKYILERMEVLGKVNVEVLKKMINMVDDTELEQKLISLLCKYDETFIKSASEKISSFEYYIRKIIIINLLNHREFNYLFKAGQEINRLLNAENPAERELAVEIISELKNVQFSDEIERLIYDDEIAVQRVAITAACKLRMKNLLQPVIGLLAQDAHKNIVLKGLQVYGDFLFDDIKDLSIKIPEKYYPDFIKIAGRIRGEHSTTFLLSKLGDDNALLKDNIVHALWIKGHEPVSTTEKETFSSLINAYLKAALDKIQDYGHIPDFEDRELIKRSIFNEVKNDLSVSLKACVLLYKKKEINRILELMELDKQDKLYNAMEMLELVLPKKISKDINLLFDFILDPHNSSRGIAKQEIKIFYDKVIFNAPLLYNPWTKAVCVYSSWKNNDTVFLEKIKESKHADDHYLVKETKDYVRRAIKETV